MTETCGCCQGIEQLTPQATANRPGLPALRYRAGTHATFLETMMARLSSLALDLPRDEFDEQGHQKFDRVYPLRDLRTRATDDPAIALLDAWAILGAVLTFYQERIANEGYLMTATERRSILELARLVGYALRPGVSASVFLAYTIDDKTADAVTIPAGAKSQSVPGPGERPQTFETSEPFEARAAWNNLQPRRTRPQTKATITKGPLRVYLKGISTILKAGDPLLIDFGAARKLYRVTEVLPDPQLDRTLVKFSSWQAESVPNNLHAILETVIHSLRDTASLSKSTAKSNFVTRLQDFSAALENRLAATANDEELAALHNETLSRLESELNVAEGEAKFKNVKNWLAPVVEKMRAGEASVPATEMTALAVDTGVSVGGVSTVADPIVNVMSKLTQPASVPPRSTNFLARTPDGVFAAKSDIGSQVVTTLQPALRSTFAAALSGGKTTGDHRVHVFSLRAKAGFFGGHLPRLPIYQRDANGNVTITGYEPPLDLNTAWSGFVAGLKPLPDVLLDAEFDKIQANSWIAIDSVRANAQGAVTGRFLSICNVKATRSLTPNLKGNSARVTDLTIESAWLAEMKENEIRPMLSSSQVLSETVVYCQSEELALAEEPIEDEICRGGENWIELDSWYPDLKSGRWAIVSGERADIRIPDPNDSLNEISVPGIKASELVMLADVIQDISTEDGEPSSKRSTRKSEARLPAEKPHTFVRFAKRLSYCYRRDSVTIYGNVVKATHGETRKEVLGSGDASQALQPFTLRQPPLTFVAAPNPRGVDSTLKLYVNDVRWHETNSLARLTPTDRRFIARANDDAQTTVVFGNGEHGARPPTGRENIRAEYRNGIGKAGNVKAEQISLLMTRPNGVKEVINPLIASGGADKESRDQARANAPLAVMALDRLVSTRDYADFARTFAGIGKAASARLADGQRELVHLTIAGADDIPIEPTSDLYGNLVLALRQYGDPFQPFRVALRELILIVISAKVRLDPDYQWDKVAVTIRSTLLDTFSFERRALGQDVVLSEVISAIQNVAGVSYVDVDRLRGIPEKTSAPEGTRQPLTPDQILAAAQAPVLDRSGKALPEPFSRISVQTAGIEDGVLRPAQLAILSPNVPDTLILNQIP